MRPCNPCGLEKNGEGIKNSAQKGKENENRQNVEQPAERQSRQQCNQCIGGPQIYMACDAVHSVLLYYRDLRLCPLVYLEGEMMDMLLSVMDNPYLRGIQQLIALLPYTVIQFQNLPTLSMTSRLKHRLHVGMWSTYRSLLMSECCVDGFNLPPLASGDVITMPIAHAL